MRTNRTPKEKIGGYVSAETAQDLRRLMNELPRSVTLGDVLDGAIRREIRRIRRQGWPSKKAADSKLRTGRPMKAIE